MSNMSDHVEQVREIVDEEEYKDCDETTNNNLNANKNEEDQISSDDEVNDTVEQRSKIEVDNEETMEEIPVDGNSVKRSSSEETSNGSSGNVVINKNADISIKVQSFKDWGYNTFMRTKQKVKEKLSRSSRTVDLDLEDRIDMIKLQQTQYKMMLTNNNRMVEQLRQNILIHQYSSRMFAELAQTDKVLSELFLSQSQSEILATGHFRELIERLVVSTKTLETLVTKTFDDMMLGIQAFETARVEYDAFKTETVRLVSQMQQKSSNTSGDQTKLQDMQERLEQKRDKYEASKSSVLIKLELLEDNKIRVIQREILNFRHAWFTLHSNCLELYSGNRHMSLSQSSEKSPQDHPDEESTDQHHQ